MTKYLSLAGLLFLTGCQSDDTLRKAFAGQYKVTLQLPAANNELEMAKEEMEAELNKAKEEIANEMEQVKEEIEAEFSDKNHLGEAIDNFVEGMDGLAIGLTNLGENLGKMGINLGKGAMKGLRFKADFREDGQVFFGKKSRLQIGSGEGNFWEIQDGKFYLWDDEQEKTAFEMKKLADGNWDLVGDEIIFHLEKLEQ